MKRLWHSATAQLLLGSILGFYLDFALRTTRWTLIGWNHLEPHAAGEPAIFAFWHETLPLMPALPLIVRKRPSYSPIPIHALVSRHRDGQFIGRVLRRFGFFPVYGSSTRGGASGARSLLATLQRGEMVAISPDGPRGPRRQAAAGVAEIAAMTGVPVVPLAARTKPSLALGTWDRMLIPLPFGCGVMVCGPAIRVARNDGKIARSAITSALNDVIARAEVP